MCQIFPHGFLSHLRTAPHRTRRASRLRLRIGTSSHTFNFHLIVCVGVISETLNNILSYQFSYFSTQLMSHNRLLQSTHPTRYYVANCVFLPFMNTSWGCTYQQYVHPQLTDATVLKIQQPISNIFDCTFHTLHVYMHFDIDSSASCTCIFSVTSLSP